MRSTRIRLLLVALVGLSLGACGGGGSGGDPADSTGGAPGAPGGPPDLSGFTPEVVTMPDLVPMRVPGSSRYCQTRGGTAVYVVNVGNATAGDSHVTVRYRDGGRTYEREGLHSAGTLAPGQYARVLIPEGPPGVDRIEIVVDSWGEVWELWEDNNEVEDEYQ